MAYTKNNIVVTDLETGSKDPHRTQIIQIASIVVDIKKLEVIPGSEFNSEVKPIVDTEQLSKLGLDEIQDEALKVNKKEMNSLMQARPLEVVWEEYQIYLSKYKINKTDKGSPILCGFNNNTFDDIILERAGRKYGGFNVKKNAWEIFHPKQNIDIWKWCWNWLESSELDRLSLDAIRTYFGMSLEGAHDALTDVYDTAELLIRFLRLQRHLASRIQFEGCCKQERLAKRGYSS